MDPLSHTISGIVLSNLIASDSHFLAYTTSFVVAANLPDIDFITRPLKTLGSPKYYHKLTHSLPGVVLLPFPAAWLTYVLYPFLSFPKLYGLFLLGTSVHVLLDALLSSSSVPLLWPFTNRRFSLNLLVGLNFRTSSRQCGKPHYIRCVRCQFRGAVFNPILIFFVLGIATALIWPAQKRVLSLLVLLGCTVYCLLIYLNRRGSKRTIVQKIPGLDPGSVFLYPSDIIPFRWLAIEENGNQYRVFSLRGIRPRLHEQELLPKPEALSHPAVKSSMSNPLYEIYRPNMAHPFAKLEEENGNIRVTWKDLRYHQDPSASLYALKLEYDKDLVLLKEEFRERWNEG